MRVCLQMSWPSAAGRLSDRAFAGKHYIHAKTQDIQDGINNLRYYAGWADKNQGKTIEVRGALADSWHA